jgi:hypothetical protein
MALDSNFQYQSTWLSVGTKQEYNWMYYYSYDYSDNWWGNFVETDYDYFSIYLDKGNYKVATSASYDEDWYDLDNSLVVYDSNGDQVASKDSYGFSSATLAVTDAGYYYVRVKNDGSSSYDYGYYDILVTSTNSAPELTGTQATLSSAVIDTGKSSGSVKILASDLLKGFTDADSDTMSVKSLTTNLGTLTQSSDKTFWTLSASTEGTATLSYQVSDGKTTTSASNYVSVVKSADAAIQQTILDSQSSEDGTDAKIKVNLAASPTGSQTSINYNVTLVYQVQDTSEGKFVLSDGSLSDKYTVTLNKSNWSDGVVMKIRGIQDYDNDGDKSYTVKQISATTNSKNYTVIVRDIAKGGDTFSLVNSGDKDEKGRDRDKPLYLVGDDGKPTEDELVGLDGADRLYGGYMVDDLDGGLGADRLYGGYEDDFLYGQGGADQLYGEADDDFLYGGGGNDRLDGGLGTDAMEGGSGDDVYYVTLSDEGEVEDTITEESNAGTDTVYVPFQVESYVLPENVEVLRMNAGFGDTSVTGNDSNNSIYGNGGDNEVDGGDGSDTLSGGRGADQLTGGAGSDTFDYDAVKDSSVVSDCDVIWDFSSGDKIDLSSIDANTTVTGNQTFSFSNLTITTFASGTAGTVRFINDYLYVNNDTDTAADMVIKVVGVDITALTASNLLVL